MKPLQQHFDFLLIICHHFKTHETWGGLGRSLSFKSSGDPDDAIQVYIRERYLLVVVLTVMASDLTNRVSLGRRG